jgi:plastocyanin
MSATVTYNGDSFSPKTVTIAKGGKVTFTSTGGNMWVAADEHPTHTEYAGTSRQQHCPDTAGTAFDQCGPGTSYSFTFSKAGTWDYHDHLNSNLEGTVIVK